MIRFALILLLLPTLAMAQQLSMAPLEDAMAAQFQAVGRVNQSGFKTKGSCSGTLIRPDVVLTAGHCAGPHKGKVPTNVFVAGWSRGDYAAARKIVRRVRHPAYGIGGHRPDFDVGLLYLEDPITEVTPLPLAEDANGVVGVLGYHRFIPHLLSGRLDCPVLHKSQQVVRIDCPVVSGNSGGPVVEQMEDGTWAVTAVVSSRQGQQALAARIPRWVQEQLETR